LTPAGLTPAAEATVALGGDGGSNGSGDGDGGNGGNGGSSNKEVAATVMAAVTNNNILEWS
jgi:hypothetical protein